MLHLAIQYVVGIKTSGEAPFAKVFSIKFAIVGLNFFTTKHLLLYGNSRELSKVTPWIAYWGKGSWSQVIYRGTNYYYVNVLFGG